jgi:phospholipid/cholesterol/gamma-HCH transport system permease protein
MASFVENIGQAGMDISGTLHGTFSFAGRVILRMFDIKTYNSATRAVLINQIYFTAVQILPLFLVGCILFGSMLIGVVFKIIMDLGLVNYLGNILVGLLVIEFAPLITALLIALRSGSAINAEIAVMKVSREMRTLEVFNIDIVDYLFIPRIVNGIVSVVLLSGLFSIVVIISGMLFSNIFFGMSAAVYTGVLLDSANYGDLVLSILKAATFGFFITMIPLRSGFSATDELTSVPITVLRGMVKVFIAILIIEVLSLLIRMI